jgi:hypothetical protein
VATEQELTKLPKHVKVGVYNYKVEPDDAAAYDYGYLGCCLNRSRRITLDPRQSDTEIRQTLLHEILHAIGSAFEIPEVERHTTAGADSKVTDKIDLLASGLLMFLRDNPGVVEWLREP